MLKVPGALSGQFMIIYHHHAVPDPLRAASGLQQLRNGINRDYFRGIERIRRLPILEVESEHGVVCKETTSMPCALKYLYHVHHASHHPCGSTLYLNCGTRCLREI